MSSPIVGAVVPAAIGSSSSDGGGVEPRSMRAHPWTFLPVSTRYVCGVESHDVLFLLPMF
jgi:hypothetical protein